MIERRTVLAGLALASLGMSGRGVAQGKTELVMWHSPGCGCCLEWKKRIEAAFGRPMRVIQTPDIAAIKRARGVPDDLMSCHTASIGGYAIEGHVPPADIKRLIATEPKGVAGLAVPGMPAGSPGMDVGHSRRDAYQVIAFDRAGGKRVFARHG